ncbi:hypothetical protein B7494_g7018 [Chlorociboria aeruginascens]|nr:hypothetical protein B7494_g7018 [Chlorociboria aeruginascens]
MPSIVALPNEILYEIVRHTPQGSLPALAATSRSIYQCAVQSIYRFIYFTNLRQQDGRYRLNQAPEWSRDLSRMSKIVDLSLFLRTIRESSLLRSYVFAASLEWNSVTGSGLEGTMIDVLHILASSVLYLYVSPAKYNLNFHTGIPINSLDLRYLDFADEYYRDGVFVGGKLISLDRIYETFAQPTLQQLSIESVRSWDYVVEPKGRARTSPVSFLSFPNSVPAGDDLAEILSWPVALKSFNIGVWPEGESYGTNTSILSAAKFIHALHHQRESLEDIFITGQWDNRGWDGSTVGTEMRDFTHLKRLGLTREFLVSTKEETRLNGLTPKAITTLYQVLPLALEELQIELAPAFEWFDRLRETSGSDFTYEAQEIQEWLAEIVKYKDDYCPRLNNITLWQRKSQAAHIGERVEWTKLAAALKNVGIQLNWVSGSGPPLFVDL